MSHAIEMAGPATPVGNEEQLRAGLTRIQWLALVIGIVALGLCVAVAAAGDDFKKELFYRSYLYAYAFWLGLALGSGAIAMIHNLSGGRWGQAARRIIEAANGSLWVLAILGLPLLYAVHTGHLFPWQKADYEMGSHKRLLLQPDHVILIGVIGFAIWLATAAMIRIGANRVEATQKYAVLSKVAGMSAIGLILYMLSMTIVVVAYIMSLTPGWYSTMFTIIFVMGQVLSAFAFTTLLNARLIRYEPVHHKISSDQFNDLASFMLAFTILWAYMSFGQMIISWMGNLKAEMAWYAHRNHGGWLVVGLSLMILQFSTPFLLLLLKSFKRNPNVLIWIALGILIMRFVDLLYLIKPSFPTDQINWMDAVLPFGIGGIFIWCFMLMLKRHKLEPPPLVDERSAMEVTGPGGHVALVGATEYGAAISSRKGPVP